ncbi:1570_t:CDS:2 [Acaulospora colombiana]|uniref:1570_t:CDS:1 n=1 Tax=Acaulospora colombiana TaxID=27376 RepID=A0ACA9L9B9_9GLOM|nr:1570_t:CDS:2 [Acaulospora colombiana]
MQRPRLFTDAQITSAHSATTTTTASQNEFYSNIEDELNKKLDNEMEQLVFSFRDMVKAAGFEVSLRNIGRDDSREVEKDKYRNALDEYIGELRAANLTTLLLNDTKTLMQLRETRKNSLTTRTRNIKNKIVQLNDAVNEAIWEMESVLGGGQARRGDIK